MKSLVIGSGQVGTSLYNVLKDTHEVYIRDIEPIEISGVEVIHLCFPYSDRFVEIADTYYDLYQPKLVINHASVAVGTTEKLKGPVCYSPIRGRHPHLEESIKTFDKFVAGSNPETVVKAYEYLKVAGIPAVILGDATAVRDLELAKLATNIRYGYDIVFMQEMERIYREAGGNINNFQNFERSYNKGYREMREWEKQRPILYGGICGGHCIRACCDILNATHPSPAFDLITKLDDKKRQESK